MASVEASESQDSAVWDEARCSDALRHLELLQDQLDELRLAIPRMIQPLRVTQPSPAHLVSGFRKAAEAASKDLNDFKLAWQSEETQAIFKRSKESYEKDQDLSAAARVPKYGWSPHSQLPDTAVMEAEPQRSADLETASEPTKQSSNIEQILDDYKTRHTDFVISTESDHRIIKIQFKVPSMTLRFVIARKTVHDKESLEVECVGNMRLFSAITRCIASRPHPNDLRYLLDMIAAYKDIRTAACSRCGKMLDDSAMTAVARRLKDSVDSGEDETAEWQAFHEGCLVITDGISSSKTPRA